MMAMSSMEMAVVLSASENRRVVMASLTLGKRVTMAMCSMEMAAAPTVLWNPDVGTVFERLESNAMTETILMVMAVHPRVVMNLLHGVAMGSLRQERRVMTATI